MAESLTNHPSLEDISIFGLYVDALKTNDEARRALSSAIVSNRNLPSSASILRWSNLLIHPDHLWWCVCKTTNVRWSIMDLTRSDSFFDALASKDATLESLDIYDDCEAFDELHADVALATPLHHGHIAPMIYQLGNSTMTLAACWARLWLDIQLWKILNCTLRGTVPFMKESW